MSLPSRIDGVTGSDNIAKLWGIVGVFLIVLGLMNLMLKIFLTMMVWLIDLLKCAMPLRNGQ